MTVSKDITGGLAIYSRVRTTLGFIVLAFIFLIAIAIGINRLHDKHTKISIGVVSSSICTPNKNSYNCELTIVYSVSGQTYTIITNQNRNYAFQKGDTIPVRYDPQNPRDGIVGPSPKYVGYTIITVALFIMILASVNIYFVYKSQSYAAVTGGLSAVGTVSRVL